MTTYKVIAMCCSTIACILSITISKVKEKKRKELAYMTWFVAFQNQELVSQLKVCQNKEIFLKLLADNLN